MIGPYQGEPPWPNNERSADGKGNGGQNANVICGKYEAMLMTRYYPISLSLKVSRVVFVALLVMNGWTSDLLCVLRIFV